MKYTYTVTTKSETKTFSDLECARRYAKSRRVNTIYEKATDDKGNVKTVKYNLLNGHISSFEKM